MGSVTCNARVASGAKESAPSMIARTPLTITHTPTTTKAEGTRTRRTKPFVWASDIRRSSLTAQKLPQARAPICSLKR
jgi:hypothetical protein